MEANYDNLGTCTRLCNQCDYNVGCIWFGAKTAGKFGPCSTCLLICSSRSIYPESLFRTLLIDHNLLLYVYLFLRSFMTESQYLIKKKKMYSLMDRWDMSPLQISYSKTGAHHTVKSFAVIRLTYLFNITHSTVFATHSCLILALEVGNNNS